jgi:gamma-glutamyltranspeptidase/glutathione hydrolase
MVTLRKDLRAWLRHDGAQMINRSLIQTSLATLAAWTICFTPQALSQESKVSNKPILNGRHWVAVTGKPLGAAAGAKAFTEGGNAVDAAVVMLGAVATMWDTLGWGGETQALIFDPRDGRVHAINALGVAPTGATPEFFRERGLRQPPEYGPLAAVTPGTPGGFLVMLAEFGTFSLEQALAPAMELAAGYPVDPNQSQTIENYKVVLRRWDASSSLLLPHDDPARPKAWSAPRPGEILAQPNLLATLQKLVDAERSALKRGATRKDAIMAAYERFYRGDIARDVVAATQAAGGLFTLEDLDRYRVYVEEPVSTTFHGVEVYKLTHWVQGPVLLQTLNILEGFDLRGMRYNSAQYVHTLYQAMNLAFADRDFYYGDPYVPPVEPIRGLLSKSYAADRAKLIDQLHNDPNVRPGDPYPYQGEVNPYSSLLEQWQPRLMTRRQARESTGPDSMTQDEAFLAGTTSIQAADENGWMVSITPSGGWIPAFIAGDTGIGLSQRMQSFDMDESANPFNVLAPGKRPRATLSPSIALRDGKPYLAFSVQGGDAQDQNLLQFLLNVVEFGMNVQQATEAANFNSYQMHSSFGFKRSEPGRLVMRADTAQSILRDLGQMGYEIELWDKTSGPITAIEFDPDQKSFMGGASDFGDDYGIAW